MSVSRGEPKAAAVKRPDPDRDALIRMPEAVLREHDGEFALMHDRELVAFIPSFEEAVLQGRRLFPPGKFTVQQVRIAPPPPPAEPVRTKRPDPDFEALSRMPEEYLRAHEREFALMHRRQVVEFFGSLRAALDAGKAHFGKGEFTVQQVRVEPVRLGSLAMFMAPRR